MPVAVTLAAIVLVALILESLPGASLPVFDAEIGIPPCRVRPEAADLPGGHVGPGARDCPRRAFALSKVSPKNEER